VEHLNAASSQLSCPAHLAVFDLLPATPAVPSPPQPHRTSPHSASPAMSAAAVCSAPRIQCQKATRASRGRVSCSATPRKQQQQLAGALVAGALQAAAMAPAAQAAAQVVGQVRGRGPRRRLQPCAAAANHAPPLFVALLAVYMSIQFRPASTSVYFRHWQFA
jgi:hypothetical protein